MALYDIFGRQAGRVRVQSRQPIYPNDTSRLEIVWEDAPLAGLFRAHLILRFGSTGKLEGEAWLGVLPWRQGLGLLAALVGTTMLRRSWRTQRSRNGPGLPEGSQPSIPTASVPPSPGGLASGADPAMAPGVSSFPPRRLRKDPRGYAPRRVPPSGWVVRGRHPAASWAGQAGAGMFTPSPLNSDLAAVSTELGHVDGPAQWGLEGDTVRVKLLKQALMEFRGKIRQLSQEADSLFEMILAWETYASSSHHAPGETPASKGGLRNGNDSGDR